jgi:hypothetical protein
MEPILKPAVLILMEQTLQRLIWGLLARSAARPCSGSTGKDQGHSRLPLPPSRTDSSRADLVGEGEGVKDTQQHPSCGDVRSLAQKCGM